MKNQIDFLRIAIITIILSLAVTYPLLWLKMLADPVQYTGADFIAFYAAGRIADNEGAAQAYDLNLQKKYQEQVVMREIESRETFPYNHLPFVIPLAQIVTTPAYLASFQRWALLMVFIFAMSVPFLMALTGDFLSRTQKLIFAFSIFLFFPIFQSVLLGQDNAIIFLGLSMLVWGIFRKKDWAAGLGLALSTVRPHFALFLLLPFLFQRRAVLGWFVLLVFVLTIFSFVYAGFSGMNGFLRILIISGSGEGDRINEENMINLIGLVRRVFPSTSPHLERTAGWIFYGIAFLFLFIFYWQNKEAISGRELSLAAIAAFFFSPHSHAQDLILLILPIMTLILILLERKIVSPARAVLIPLTISFILLFSYYSPLLTHSVPYVLMTGLLFAIWKYQNESSAT